MIAIVEMMVRRDRRGGVRGEIIITIIMGIIMVMETLEMEGRERGEQGAQMRMKRYLRRRVEGRRRNSRIGKGS